MNHNDNLTLEERLDLAARSVASSQEAATAMVKHFSSMNAVNIFAGKPDITLLYELATQELDSDMDLDVDHYNGFCRLFVEVLHNDNDGKPRTKYGPVFGVRANNVLVLLGLMLYDQLRDRWTRHEIYNCTRMTLAQYLAAIVEQAPDFKPWADKLLQQHDGNLSLTQTMENILRMYIDGWSVYELWDRVAAYTAQACLHDRDDDADEIEKLLQEAQNCTLELPDIFDAATPARVIRERLYLQDRDYNKATFRRLTALAPYPGFQKIMAQFSDGDRLDDALAKINLAVMDIYMVFVQPFISMNRQNP